GVEALLAAADVTGDDMLRERALGVARRAALEFAGPHFWGIPQHFNSPWAPQLELNRDRPDDQFQPYGATVGHGLEWSRLLLHLEASLADPPDWLLPPPPGRVFFWSPPRWGGGGGGGF